MEMSMSRLSLPSRGRRRTSALMAGLGLLAVAPGLRAQAAYPSKPLTMVVPFPPGGVADTVGRPVAEALARILDQPVVVENKAGAGGGIGMAQVARSKPDGYTLLMALSSITILPEADRVLERPPMYQLKDLVPIARFTADPTVLVVRANSPWKTAKAFIDDAKVEAGRHHLRLVRQLRDHARADGDAQAGVEHLHAARALHRRRSGHHRPDRRTGRRARNRPVDHRAACRAPVGCGRWLIGEKDGSHRCPMCRA